MAEDAAPEKDDGGSGGFAKVALLLKESEAALQEPLSQIITHWKVSPSALYLSSTPCCGSDTTLNPKTLLLLLQKSEAGSQLPLSRNQSRPNCIHNCLYIYLLLLVSPSLCASQSNLANNVV